MVINPLIINVIGVGAAVCSMTSFAPQLVKIVRDRDAASVSLRMYVVTVIAFVLWIAYGAAIGRWPIVASNAVCLLMSSAVLVLKFKFGPAREAG